MYRLRPGIKNNPEKRWALPDRVFFACGACHILAYAFLERFPDDGFRPVWIKPATGFTGNHIAVVNGAGRAFDYHGFTHFDRLLVHMQAKANRWWPGWSYTLVDLPKDVLISEAKSKTYDGLWLREPKQFLHDALPRAAQLIKKINYVRTTGTVLNRRHCQLTYAPQKGLRSQYLALHTFAHGCNRSVCKRRNQCYFKLMNRLLAGVLERPSDNTVVAQEAVGAGGSFRTL